jgi:hypothetical protein
MQQIKNSKGKPETPWNPVIMYGTFEESRLTSIYDRYTAGNSDIIHTIKSYLELIIRDVMKH